MIRRVYGFFGAFRKYVLLGIFLVGLDVVCEVLIPVLMASIIDYGIRTNNHSHIVQTGIFMLLASVAAIFTSSSNSYVSSKSSQGMARNMRNAIFDQIQLFSFGDMDKFSTATLITRATSDVNAVQQAVMMTLRLLLRGPMMLCAAVFMAARIDKELTLILLVALPVLSVILFYIFARVGPLFVLMQQKLDVLTRIVQENIIGQRIVKAFVRKDFEEKKFGESADELALGSIRAVSQIALAMPLMMLVMNCVTLAALWFGGEKVIGGRLGIGGLNGFIAYSMQILVSLMMISGVLLLLARSGASVKRILAVLDTAPSIIDPPDGAELRAESGEVRFEDVSFCYPGDTSGETLSHISFEAPSGSVVAIISPTGGGKSTLINLIPRLYDVGGGRVLVDGRDVRDYKLGALRGVMGVVQQKNVLFSGTISENVRWGKPDATDEEVAAACRLAQAHNFIMGLPNGYETRLEQGGTNLSGGQRQRLCIARAVVRKPKILILDDSSSALDTTTEGRIRVALREQLGGVTVFLVAQRISSVRDADMIIVLDDGKISGLGTHRQLLATNEIYREINASQNEEVV